MFRTIISAALFGSAAIGAPAGAQEAEPRPAIQGIVALFEKYQVVGVGDVHAADEVWKFYDALVATPSFRAKVDDVTFECGNARYQSLMDRYIAGENIPYASLQPIWRDNVFGGTMCESPVIRRFLEGIRAANLKSKVGRKLRVLLIDPPVDWSKAKSREDLGDRRDSMTSVLEREVYAKNRKALFLVGTTHIERPGPAGGPPPGMAPPPGGMQQKRLPDGRLVPLPGPGGPTMKPFGPPNPAGPGMPPPPGGMQQKRGADGQMLPLPGAGPTMRPFGGSPGGPGARPAPGSDLTPIARLENAHPGTTYSIATYLGVADDTARFESWAARFAAPWLLDLKGTWVGRLRASSENLMRGPDGQPMRVPGRQLASAWDGLLFVQPRSKLTRSAGSLPCNDAAFMKTLEERQAIRGTPADSPFGVRAICAEKPGQGPYFTD